MKTVHEERKLGDVLMFRLRVAVDLLLMMTGFWILILLTAALLVHNDQFRWAVEPYMSWSIPGSGMYREHQYGKGSMRNMLVDFLGEWKYWIWPAKWFPGALQLVLFLIGLLLVVSIPFGGLERIGLQWPEAMPQMFFCGGSAFFIMAWLLVAVGGMVGTATAMRLFQQSVQRHRRQCWLYDETHKQPVVDLYGKEV